MTSVAARAVGSSQPVPALPEHGVRALPPGPVGTETLWRSGDGSTVTRSVLPSGLRVISESLPSVRSVAVGIWVRVGSRDETGGLAGASHFLEHLLFKGTHRRDALEISSVMDAVGGEMNAFTTPEYTCYYARVLDADLPLAIDVLADMLTSSVVAGVDVEAERGVVLEEIAMRDDDPADLVHEVFGETVFGADTPLGRSVLGTVETITSMSRPQVAGYYRRRYTPPAMVVAAAGRLDHDRLVADVERAFGERLAGDASPLGLRPSGAGSPPAGSGVRVLRRPTEQANIVLGGRGIARGDDRRFALAVLNNALGGGMSSRLFQEVREKRGLAYSVYSWATMYADSGLFGVYAGCQPARAPEVLGIIREQLDDIGTRGLTGEELTRGKGQAKGSLVLGLEDPTSRMHRIGKSDLVHGELRGLEDALARTDAVTGDQVRAVAADLLSGPLTLAVVGPVEEDHDFAAAVAR